MAAIKYQTFRDHSTLFYLAGAVLAALVAIGGLSALFMEHNGHIVTGMNNKVVWGMPHVFAIFLIVAASGALNVASIASVFGKPQYKKYARFSGILAIALLIAGLLVLVLDLGRPDRLIVAMTYYNFKSIFAWNIFLYTGFMAIVGIYLWTMFQKSINKYTKIAGFSAFAWRLILTTGTGSIFGFLVAREAYDSAMYAPLFIASSFVYGLAFTVLILTFLEIVTGKKFMDSDILKRFSGLFIVFMASVLFITAILHLANLYATEHHGVEKFLLFDANSSFPTLFWLGQVIIGSLLPLAILAFSKTGASRFNLNVASVLFLLGGLFQLYVILIGGQSYPLELFPGMEVSSIVGDGEAAHYVASIYEIMLGIGGVALALLITGIAIKILPFLPKPENFAEVK